MANAALFELVDVSLAIDDAVILDGIDLVIPDTGITVLLGPSGAGKSMLLRLLNRLEVPTSGEVRFRGEPVDAIDPLTLRRRVGMVFQRPAPFPGTVRDNLLVADPDAGDDDLAGALHAARLDPAYLDRSADELSGGEAQRMCLARTLVTRPEALLMDEPTSALDPEARRGLERTAHRLAGGGRPLVWVTHDLDQAGRLADEVVVLIRGRVAGREERIRFLSDEGGSDEGGGDDVVDRGPHPRDRPVDEEGPGQGSGNGPAGDGRSVGG